MKLNADQCPLCDIFFTLSPSSNLNANSQKLN
jgi:hypothetical protein